MKDTKRYVMKGLGIAAKLLLIVIFLFPFYWMVMTSFKTYDESLQFPPSLIPSTFMWENYVTTWNAAPFAQYSINSVIVTFGVIVLQLLVIIPASYAFARYKFKGDNIMFAIVLVAFMIPINVTFVPVYIMMANWGWLNTLLPQIIPHGANAFGIFLLRQSFRQIPEEIVESARLDNASEFKIIREIMIPIAKPTIFTVILLSFVDNWNAYFWPLVMTNTDSLRTLPVAVSMIKGVEDIINWPILMAGSIIMVLPIVLMYIFAGKKIVQAFVYSGIK